MIFIHIINTFKQWIKQIIDFKTRVFLRMINDIKKQRIQLSNAIPITQYLNYWSIGLNILRKPTLVFEFSEVRECQWRIVLIKVKFLEDFEGVRVKRWDFWGFCEMGFWGRVCKCCGWWKFEGFVNGFGFEERKKNERREIEKTKQHTKPVVLWWMRAAEVRWRRSMTARLERDKHFRLCCCLCFKHTI